jgi:hypothetical protein
MYLNYDFSYKSKGKHIFVPNEESIERGLEVLGYCSNAVAFPSYFFHYASGGHVTALHRHLENRFFFRIDLQNFFYSIARNRVAAGLYKVGHRNARDLAKWSCVKNPFGHPSYALPIGFIQSPILASLVMLHSPITSAIEKTSARGTFVSVFFDDLIGSAMDQNDLQNAYSAILEACRLANFPPNDEKLIAPADKIVAFNCDLSHGSVAVTEERIQKFLSKDRSNAALTSFETYIARVSSNNSAE